MYTRSPPSPRYSTASTYRATLLISHINQLWNAECSHTALDLNTRQHGHIWPRAARPRDQYRVPPPIANCSQRTTQSESQVSVPAHPFQCARERSRRGSSKCSQPKMLPKRPVRAHATRGASLQHHCGRFTAAQFLRFCTVARRSRGPSRSRREDVTCARAPAGVIRAQALRSRHRSSTVRRLKAGLGEDTSAQRVLTNARGKPWARARHSHHRWPPHAALARSRRGR